MRQAAEAAPAREDAAEAAGAQDDGAVHHQANCVEHCRQHHDLQRDRARFRLDELWEQRQHEQGHLRVQDIGQQPLPEHGADGVTCRAGLGCSRHGAGAHRLPGEIEKIGRTGIAHDVVGDGHDQEELRQAERRRQRVAIGADLDAGQGREARRLALARTARGDQQHVGARRQGERQRRDAEQGERREIDHQRIWKTS